MALFHAIYLKSQALYPSAKGLESPCILLIPLLSLPNQHWGAFCLVLYCPLFWLVLSSSSVTFWIPVSFPPSQPTFVTALLTDFLHFVSFWNLFQHQSPTTASHLSWSVTLLLPECPFLDPYSLFLFLCS